MHEMSLTRSIVSIVGEHAGRRRVLRVRLEIGKLSAVVPEAIRFCFDVIAQGTVAEGAELEIIEIPGLGRCFDCGAEVEMDGPLAVCPCGSRRLLRVAGEELKIKEMELEAA